MVSEQVQLSGGEDAPPSGYEPPRIETVLGPGQLEREVLYAGPLITTDTT